MHNLMAAASGFSGAVRLVGLDDHISPSQACVKPVQAAGGKGERTCAPSIAFQPFGMPVLRVSFFC
jgi:hypothetical protein